VSRFDAVHQFHAGTAPGDAITNQMLEVRGHLRRLGWRSEIFAEHVAPDLADRILPLGAYRGDASELLLAHHSQGHLAFDDVMDLPNPIVAVYHNVTPEHFFEDAAARRFSRMGREQLGYLARRALFGVADSNFNRVEMLSAGFRRVDVLPVRVDFGEFEDAGMLAGRASNDWLFVGRITPNKCQHLLVEAFAAYSRTFDDRARLLLVGGTSDEPYRRELFETAERLHVADRVLFRGKVSDRDLHAAFAEAGVYVSLSDHEGFGVPLLEAMAARLPVVAYGSSAVPETLGGAGVLLRTQDPTTVAATVHAVLSDPGLRSRLVDRQSERMAKVGAFDVPRALRRMVARAEGAEPPLEVQVQGPFETSYSLAAMNRKLALELDRAPDVNVSLYPTEGPGDYVPDDADLARHPDVVPPYRRSGSVPYPDVVIRQMWPPRTIDSPGGITLEYFPWEESRVPGWIVEDFNAHLDGIGVTSTFVAGALRDSGVTIPVRVVGNGVDAPDPSATIEAPELEGLSGFTFLHVSSAFPRKGTDVLLRAYFAAFSASDDVVLVLKTHPNPHNVVGQLLDALRATHDDPPGVRWIDRDLDDAELAGLFVLADCYVHPARGEGFGLPVAEAMLAGVPVISVAWSGLADFVSEETAVTVPFTLVAADSHLSEEGARWAEPDAGALATELVRMAADPGSADVVARVARARQLIATEFSWEAAAARWWDFIAEVEDELGCRRVAMVTSWNSRCGIAENSRYLVEHTRGEVNYDIFADVDVEVIDPLAERGVVRTWKDRWTPELGDLEDALLVSEADVLHVQFNFGFFEFGHLAELLDRQLDRRGVVLTMHRTLDYDDRGDLLTLRQIGDTLGRVDQLIVHQESDARYLADMGIEENVTLVPIGSAPPPALTPEEVRAQLGLGDRPVVGTFGFLLPHKGTLELVEAVDQLRRDHPDVLLLALCARYPNVESEEYEARIRAEVATRGMENNVLLLTDYLSDDAARVLLRGADVIVLPYRDTGESSSAALRFVLPLGRAIAVTDQPLFDDARDAVLVMEANDVDGIARSVGRVLDDAPLRNGLAARAEQRSLAFRWERVVAEHRRIYAEARRAARSRLARVG
jgi:glycosyltransferase involved in cell wall biosynthesis